MTSLAVCIRSLGNLGFVVYAIYINCIRWCKGIEPLHILDIERNICYNWVVEKIVT